MDVAQYDDKSSPIADISPDGDVVLVVGPQNVRLRVHSQCLRCASKVFGAMLGPHWSEEQGLPKKYPQEIPLVEDDADAFRIICCVIHHRNDAVRSTENLTPREILQLAVATDKYDLSIALRYASAQWLKPRGNADMMDKGYLMAAAFLFGDMQLFAANTLDLIVYCKGSYLELLDDKILSQFVPWKTIYLLEERRNRMRAELGQLIIKWMNGSCSCGWGEKRGNKYKEIHPGCGPLRMLEIPISDIIKKMEMVPSEERKWHSGSFGPGYYHEPTGMETLHGQLESMKKKGEHLSRLRSE